MGIQANVNCPQTFPITLQRMQAKSRQIYIFNAGCSIQGGQAHSKLLLVMRPDSRNAARIEKFLQAFMLECFDHKISYTPYCAIRNNFSAKYFIN